MVTLRDTRFLIVDDFSTMRRIIRGLLKEIGVDRCGEAEDGSIALNMLRTASTTTEPWGFVISDINMPNMNGIELSQQMKKSPLLMEIPVLFVTAEATKEIIVESMKAGAAGYLVKPFTIANLEEKIIKALQRKA